MFFEKCLCVGMDPWICVSICVSVCARVCVTKTITQYYKHKITFKIKDFHTRRIISVMISIISIKADYVGKF